MRLGILKTDVEQEQYPADIDPVDACLLTGSKSGVYKDRAWIPG